MTGEKKLVIRIDNESKKILRNLFVSVTIMRCIVEYIYRTQISVIYNYSGFTNDFSMHAFIVSLFLMYSIIPLIVHYIKSPSFSGMVLYIIYLINFVPGTILMTYMRFSFVLPWYIYYFLIFALGIFLPRHSYVNSNRTYMDKKAIYFIATFFSAFVLFVWIYYAHGRIQLGLDDVYSTRLEAREFGMPMILRYIFASMKIVLPIFVVWALRNKDDWIAIIFSFVQLLAFFTDGSKSTLFSLLISIAGFFFLRNNENRIIAFPWLLSFLGLLSIFEFNRFRAFQISGIFFRRVMFVPQSLNIRYFDFFSQNQPDYFRSSLLKVLWFSSPYGSIARTIGKYYSGSDTLAANNGLFSDAFANLGYAGILIMPIAIILMLKYLDKYSDGLEIYTIIGSVIPFTMALMSASFFTMFLSHGVVALLLIFYFLPRKSGNVKLRQ